MQPLHHIAQLRARRPMKSSEATLLFGVIIQIRAIVLRVRTSGQLRPKLQPDALAMQPSLPSRTAVAVASAAADIVNLLVDGTGERQKYRIRIAEGPHVEIIKT